MSNGRTQNLTAAAGLSADPVSVEPYRSEEFYKLERERVFARSWLMLCREEEIPKPGDYVVKDIEVCGASVLVIRGKDGNIRAFHNVCSHRGNLLAWEKSGSAAPLLVCRYHSWSFAPDGRLMGVPAQETFANLKKEDCGLTRIASDVWEGFVFVNLERQPSVGLREFLGEMGEFLQGIQYAYADNPVVIQASFDCNWKVACDAFSEAYHVHTIHRNTLAPVFGSDSNRYGQLLWARFYGPHRSCTMYGNSNYQPAADAAVEGLAMNGLEAESETMAAIAEKMQAFYAHPAVNPSRTKDWGQDVHAMFPNTHLYTLAPGFVTLQFWPTSMNTTRFEMRVYLPEAKGMRLRFYQEMFLARLMDIAMEDVKHFGRTQRALESRGKDFMQLQDNEVLIRHSIHHVQKWVDSATVAEALQKESA
jgi:phenylpropionate dioxygenase-like ring-hydroxylating dioxygenase large terminal subunit